MRAGVVPRRALGTGDEARPPETERPSPETTKSPLCTDGAGDTDAAHCPSLTHLQTVESSTLSARATSPAVSRLWASTRAIDDQNASECSRSPRLWRILVAIDGDCSSRSRKPRSVSTSRRTAAGRRHRRRTRQVGEQGDLTDDVAGSEIAHLGALPGHAEGALDDDEELLSALTFADQGATLVTVDLVREHCDLPQVSLGAAREERHAFQ